MNWYKLASLTATALLSTVGVANAAPITAAYEYSSAGTLSDSRPFTLGFSFTLSQAQSVNALGYTTVGFVQDQEVGIWDLAGNLIVSSSVLTTDQVIGHFAWHDISPVLLGAGSYVIGGTYQGGLFPSYAAGVTTISGYTWTDDRQVEGTGLNFPTLATGGNYGQNGIPQVNFSVAAVPEPATWAMMIVGMGAVGFALRQRRSPAITAA